MVFSTGLGHLRYQRRFGVERLAVGIRAQVSCKWVLPNMEAPLNTRPTDYN